MDHIQILFKEYDTLRAESVARLGGSYQFLTIAAVLFTALTAWISGHQASSTLWIIIGVFVASIILFAVVTWRHLCLVAKRLQQIEARINDLSGANLLEWETSWGMGATGLFLRRAPK